MSEATLSPVVATQRIDGTILPGTVFVPSDEQQLADLEALDAVREPTEAEILLYERMQSNAAASTPAKPTGRGRRTAAAQTPAAGDNGGDQTGAAAGDNGGDQTGAAAGDDASATIG